MFVLVTLFIVCLVAAVAIPVIYQLFSDTGAALVETIRPAYERYPDGHPKTKPGNTSYENTTIPHGLVSNETRSLLAWADAGHSKAKGQFDHQFSGDNISDSPHRVDSVASQSQSPSPSDAKQRMQRGSWLVREDRRTDYGKVKIVGRPENADRSNLRAWEKVEKVVKESDTFTYKGRDTFTF